MSEITKGEAKEAIKRMSKIAEKVGLVSLKEKPEEIADLSIGPKELLEIAEEVRKRSADWNTNCTVSYATFSGVKDKILTPLEGWVLKGFE